MQQLRWIFSLTVLAAFSLLGLQTYIWQQGIQQEHIQFSRALEHAVYEAAEEFMTPDESVFIVDDSQLADSFRIKTPGLLLIQIGRVDTTFTINVGDPPHHQAHRERVITEERIEELSITDLIRTYDFDFPDSTLGFSADIGTDTLSSILSIRHERLCPNCTPGFSHLSVNSFKPILQEQLSKLGIDADFQWGVLHREDWLIVDGDTSRIKQSEWKLPFFPVPTELSGLTASPLNASLPELRPPASPYVLLYFPNQHWYLLRSMGPTLLISSVLVLFVLGCIGYTVFVILRQKQLSQVKTDFINNMTHELKTPISTIALACEAMQDADVDLPEASKEHYLNMIANENERLGSQVEKVLQMALLDKDDLGLTIEPVHVHLLLEEIIHGFSLQLKQRNGHIDTSFRAKPDLVSGDLMHLRQMFTNLLDNANKYSPGTPEIRVETSSTASGIEVAIHDKGIGIHRDALRKIFDRFYRVPTGNVHDVKGFGLGLSYVQTMALAHGGHVQAKSKPGLGSSFYLFLPYSHD